MINHVIETLDRPVGSPRLYVSSKTPLGAGELFFTSKIEEALHCPEITSARCFVTMILGKHLSASVAYTIIEVRGSVPWNQ